jgi:alpha-1,2-mannosyltransferase
MILMHDAAMESIENRSGASPRPMPAALRRLLVWVLCTLLFALALIAAAPQLHSGSVLKMAKDSLLFRTGDDGSYYMAQADQAARQSPNALYETVFFQRGVRYIYPPTALLLYRIWLLGARAGIHPFWLMNLMLASALWGTLILAGQFFLDIAQMPGATLWSQRDRWLARVLVALLGLTFLPLVKAYCLGQMQTLINLAMVACVFLWMRGKRAAPGLWLGLACLLKPQASLFLLWGLLRRQWSFAASFCAVVAVGTAISVAIFGWHNHVEYLRVLHFLSRRGDAFYANQSWNGLAHHLLRIGNARYAMPTSPYPPYSATIYWSTLASSALLVLAALVVPRWQQATGDLRDVLLFSMATVMASPIAWEHHYGVFFLVFLAWMPVAFRTRRGFAALLAAYLLMASTLAPLFGLMLTRWTFLLSHVYWGGLAIFLWTLTRKQDWAVQPAA